MEKLRGGSTFARLEKKVWLKMNKKLGIVVVKVEQLGGIIIIVDDEQCFLVMLRLKDSNDSIIANVMQIYMQFSI